MRLKGAGNKRSNEGRVDPLKIAFEFSQSDITRKILFVNPLERTREVANMVPQAFAGVDMHFADATAIIVPGPFNTIPRLSRAWTDLRRFLGDKARPLTNV